MIRATADFVLRMLHGVGARDEHGGYIGGAAEPLIDFVTGA